MRGQVQSMNESFSGLGEGLVFVPLSDSLALAAADVSLEFRLAMADSIVYATALAEDAELVTSDSDLRNLPGVTFLPKAERGRR